jgi:hypothetical protein
MGGRGRGGGGRGGKRNGVSCAKPADPPFIRRMKEQLGYKDASPSVDTKVSIVVSIVHSKVYKIEKKSYETRTKQSTTMMVFILHM